MGQRKQEHLKLPRKDPFAHIYQSLLIAQGPETLSPFSSSLWPPSPIIFSPCCRGREEYLWCPPCWFGSCPSPPSGEAPKDDSGSVFLTQPAGTGMERPDQAKKNLMLHQVREVLQLPAPLGSTVKREGRWFGSPGAIRQSASAAGGERILTHTRARLTCGGTATERVAGRPPDLLLI